jgi:hypothetical protein
MTMIKDDLIGAVCAAHNDGGCDALDLLAKVRCDNCKHWSRHTHQRARAEWGECERIGEDYYARDTDDPASVEACGGQCKPVLNARADFFCALFEAKP